MTYGLIMDVVMDSILVNKKISFAWWNTSLSPYSKENKSSAEHRNYVMYIISKLILDKNIDVLCLCEVSQDDVINISQIINSFTNSFEFYDGTLKDGRKKFDFCIIYRADILHLIDSAIISKPLISKKIHAGQEVNFYITLTGEPLTLYLAHWSSRMYDYENSPTKIQLGSLLRDAVNDCLGAREIKYVIILGDFNEEPFNLSMTEALFASRDIALVKKTPQLLYNPFWRHMVYSTLHPDLSENGRSCGTYYYRGDQTNRWKTFDQIIFSSHFVNGNTWFLNESHTEVYCDDEFISYIFDAKSKFDHLPIISVIERN